MGEFSFDNGRDYSHNGKACKLGAGFVLVGDAAFKAVVRGEELLGCVRFAHGSATIFMHYP